MVFRMEIIFDEILDILGVKYSAGSANGYTLSSGVYEISDINLVSKSLLPNKARVNNSIDDIRLRSNLTTNKTLNFTKKYFFSIQNWVLLNHIWVFWKILWTDSFNDYQELTKVKNLIMLLEPINFI